MNFLDPRLPRRFWSKCIPEPNSGCWLWIANANQNGYGRVSMSKGTKGRGGKTTMLCAHRLAYEVFVGKVPAGMELDHKCRNRSCCNPAHVEPVTHAENVKRGVSPHAANARKTHCAKGHEFTLDNIIRVSTRPSARHCRKCQQERVR